MTYTLFNDFSDENAGVILRCAADIFKKISEYICTTECSFVESYNDKIGEKHVDNPGEVKELLRRGILKRKLRETTNTKSNHGHGIFTITVRKMMINETLKQTSKVIFIHLAASLQREEDFRNINLSISHLKLVFHQLSSKRNYISYELPQHKANQRCKR